jgi:hypothetical protein
MTIKFPSFDRYPQEGHLIGRMVTIYGDMEFDLMNCVASVHDLDMALKVMFKPRGETNRVDIADALARSGYDKVGLGTEFSEVIGNFRFCLSVRNQYAHSQWFDAPSVGLGFVDMEDLANSKTHIGQKNLTVYPVDLPLVTAQANYFGYVQDCLRWLPNAYAAKTGRRRSFVLPKPAKVQQPTRHKPGILPTRPTLAEQPDGSPKEGDQG